jgi:uncharacterized membrane protein YedE/YeeE
MKNYLDSICGTDSIAGALGFLGALGAFWLLGALLGWVGVIALLLVGVVLRLIWTVFDAPAVPEACPRYVKRSSADTFLGSCTISKTPAPMNPDGSRKYSVHLQLPETE